MVGMPGGMEWLIIGLALVAVFGVTKLTNGLPEFVEMIGSLKGHFMKGKNEFESELSDIKEPTNTIKTDIDEIKKELS